MGSVGWLGEIAGVSDEFWGPLSGEGSWVGECWWEGVQERRRGGLENDGGGGLEDDGV